MGLLTRNRTRSGWSVPKGKSLDESLTAAGERLPAGQRGTEKQQRLMQPWQARAWAYYDVIPEIKYAAQFYSRALSLLDLYPAKLNDRGEWEQTEDEKAVAQLERIQDPGGGRSGLLGTYGRQIFIVGETYLFVSEDPETQREQWEMLSKDELRKTDRGYERRKAPGLLADSYTEPNDDEWEPVTAKVAVAYRLWKRHPRYSELADSTMMGVLDVCEELLMMTRAVRARGRLRLAGSGGILLVNGSVTPASQDGSAADENAEEDPFLEDLTTALTASIADEGAPSAIVPMVVRVDSDGDLDHVMKLIQIVDPTQLYPESGLRREAQERLGIGLDMPPEVLTGIADANHWTGWQIDEQTWKAHLEPIADQLVDDLTAAFYRPTLRAENVADWDQYAIKYDAARVVNHPDRAKDAKDLYDKRAIGKRALRESANFNEDDAPTQEELDEMLGVQTRDASLAKYGIPSVKAGGIEPDPGILETRAGTVDGGTVSAEAVKAPPEPPTGGDSPPSVAGAGMKLGSRILGAADLAVHRARELAGSRIRSHAKRDPELSKLIDGVPNGRIAPTLGHENVRKVCQQTDRQLVAGARDLIKDSLRLHGLDPATCDMLGDRIEQHAARTLYQETPRPLPPTFENYVEGLLEVG